MTNDRAAAQDSGITSAGRTLTARGFGVIDFGVLPAGVATEIVPLKAHDGGAAQGILYFRGAEDTVVCFTHPRGNQTRHYAMPFLLDAGYATFGLQCRWPNNDTGTIHEMLLSDVAAAMVHLRSRGFKRVILCGNSGGGSLWCFYQSQAETEPSKRLVDTAAGDPYDLRAVEMPPADAIVNLAAHEGEGLFLLKKIDPSVVDENDPYSCRDDLNMYHHGNGFRLPPEPSSYSSEFMVRYRAAQVERVARLDAIARSYIDEQRYFQAVLDGPGFARETLSAQEYITRRAKVGRYMVIYRTEADPAYLDLSLHAQHSTRGVGSLAGPRPDYVNYAEGGFARVMTPRGWLSTWSGLSSRAGMPMTMPLITVPTLIMHFTSDNGCWGDDADLVYEASGAADKTILYKEGDHYGLPVESRRAGMAALVEWLRERFPAVAVAGTAG